MSKYVPRFTGAQTHRSTEKVGTRISTQEVAELLGIDISTLRRLMRKGRLVAFAIFDLG